MYVAQLLTGKRLTVHPKNRDILARCRTIENESQEQFPLSTERISVPASLPQKVVDQIQKVGLPTGGAHPFVPKLVKNKKGDLVLEKGILGKGPKAGKIGWLMMGCGVVARRSYRNSSYIKDLRSWSGSLAP
jgi:hypothetical protein